MSQLQCDFLGPFVECNGAVNRPPAPTALDLTGKVVAKNIIYTPRVRVIDAAGREEEWHSCGEVSAYHDARQSLSQAEFEHFAAMACGPQFSRNAAARALYPQMAALYPNGIDYLSADYRAHSAQDEQMKKSFYARREAAYQAKRAAQPPAPASPGPTPKALATVSMNDVLRRMGATPIAPTPSPAPRRRAKP